jgi:hypothetical protein
MTVLHAMAKGAFPKISIAVTTGENIDSVTAFGVRMINYLNCANAPSFTMTLYMDMLHPIQNMANVNAR